MLKHVFNWLGPVVLLCASIAVFAAKGYVGSTAAASPASETAPLEPDGVASSIPVAAILASAAVDRSWTPGDRALLVVVGTDVCGASLIEAEEWAAAATAVGGPHRVLPLAVILNTSEDAASRFATVAELSFPTVASSDGELRDAFGFSEHRPSRQLAVLVDLADGRVVGSRFLANGPTPTAGKADFLHLAAL